MHGDTNRAGRLPGQNGNFILNGTPSLLHQYDWNRLFGVVVRVALNLRAEDSGAIITTSDPAEEFHFQKHNVVQSLQLLLDDKVTFAARGILEEARHATQIRLVERNDALGVISQVTNENVHLEILSFNFLVVCPRAELPDIEYHRGDELACDIFISDNDSISVSDLRILHPNTIQPEAPSQVIFHGTISKALGATNSVSGTDYLGEISLGGASQRPIIYSLLSQRDRSVNLNIGDYVEFRVGCYYQGDSRAYDVARQEYPPDDDNSD